MAPPSPDREPATLGAAASYLPRVTSPDPVLPTARRQVGRELVGLLALALGIAALCLIAYDVDSRLLAAIGAVVAVAVGWRLLTSTSEE